MKFILTAFCLSELIFSVACSKQDEHKVSQKSKTTTSAAQTKQPIKIGAILPLTGPLAYLGEGEKNAIKLAAQRASNQYQPIKLVIEDSRGHPADAVTAANKLISIDKVAAIITSTTSVSRAVLPIATNAKLILAALCMDPTIQKESPFAFRLYEGMDQEAETLLKFYNNSKAKRVGMLYVNHAGTVQQLNDFILPGLKKNGINLVYQESYELNDNDFRDSISKLRNANVQSLIVIGFGFKYLSIFKALSEQHLLGKIQITGGWGFIAPNKVPAPLLEGIVVASPQYVFAKNNAGLTFINEYKKLYGEKPNFDDAFAFQAAKILMSSLANAHGQADKAANAMRNSKYKGVMGAVTIGKDGALHVPMGLGIIRKGHIVPLSGAKL